VALFGTAGLHPIRVDSVRPLFQTDLLMPVDDPEVGFRLRPNLDTWFKLTRLRTNSHGLRYRELDPAKPPGVIRVAVMGSSFTLPAGVELEDAFHARLERRFDPEGSGNVQFVNFSVGAFHPAQNLAVLEGLASDYDPDLVLFCFTEMAAGAALSRHPASIILPQPRIHPFFHSFLWELVRLRAGGEPEPPDVAVAAPENPQQRVIPVIVRLGQFAERTGIPVVAVRLAFEETVESETDRRLKRTALRHGLGWVDTRSAFRGRDTRALWIYPLDPHPNADGHALFAEVIGDYLEAAGLVSPGSS
jgi:hypothetical protein